MKKLHLFLALIAMISLACQKDNVDNPDIKPEETHKEKLVRLVNEYREAGCQCGDDYMEPTTPLQWDELLEEAAQIHADDMKENEFFDHTGSDGSSAAQRMTRVGYKHATWGENIYYGWGDEERAIEAWIASPPHCRNIMKPGYTEMGIARNTPYAVQVFGRKKN